MKALAVRMRALLRSFPKFAEFGGTHLYQYQLQPARAILESVRLNQGLTFVLMLPRQSGKDELLTHLVIYLMRLLSDKDRSIVMVNPTYKPQTIQAIQRLERRLHGNLFTRGHWRKRSDFMRLVGNSQVSFLSGDGSASVVGATASLLLVINEAQDISPEVYDKKFAPMAASRNATRLLCGTAWTSHTLLAREKQAALLAQEQDGVQRVFVYSAPDVFKENHRYQTFVEGVLVTHGRNHPLVRSQYFSEEIDQEAGLFNPARRALMQADRPEQVTPLPGQVCAFCLDVAGQDEARMQVTDDEAPLNNTGRDAVSLSVVDIDLTTLETLAAPTYRVVMRRSWVGSNHLQVFGQIKALADIWKPQHFVVDASGVGESMWALLERHFEKQVHPVKFSQVRKSEIGWRFLAIIETGRFRDCVDDPVVRRQYEACTSEMLPGPNKILRWGVPEGTRDAMGARVHDDAILSDSLVAVLDDLDWRLTNRVQVIPSRLDPLKELEKRF